ncbi:fused methyl-galactoside transporter subunits of ABC superfamily: ATP-binding components [uncultured spirochete]|uniref:Fused methyl-galactoside transporter subunits of ABC superfamily: ATP-binding components n=1 Tax=uncultured spirochete TaxID=156406 RepID=A0A3P3XR45_9SPIR|nr:fused methyl-galactoside transporter subunits of ABC superfamily: ATP-binding components [uncultured spirochete]
MGQYILEMQNITKIFPGVKALDNVSFAVRRGEVHGLVGENGAGKSTLMKILNGVLAPDSGNILVDGRPITFKNTKQAQACGISLIYQEFNLVNTLSVAENIYLGFLQTDRAKFVDWKKVRTEASELIKRLGFDFNVREKVENLSVAEKQLVEIAKALSLNAQLIAMDEPTSSLTANEIDKLFYIIQGLKERGITIIYISHKLDEVMAICNNVTVLRDGRIIDTKMVGETNNPEIISKMVGRPVEMAYPRRPLATNSEVVLEVRNLSCAGFVKDISFTLRKGEVLGIAGLVGSGRTELVEAIFGARHVQNGEVFVHGHRTKIRSTADGKRCSIGLVTEDRKETGLALGYNVTDNIIITNLQKVRAGLLVSKNLIQSSVGRYVDDLGIKTPSIRQTVVNLSGGNQQKVVLAKWLFSDVEILILDEPTRGIDVGAKYEIYLLMNALVEKGKSIIMISSELPEVLGMSDRVIVINEGRKKGELQGQAMTPEAVMSIAIQ